MPDAVGTQSTQCVRKPDMHQVNFLSRSEAPHAVKMVQRKRMESLSQELISRRRFVLNLNIGWHRERRKLGKGSSELQRLQESQGARYLEGWEG